MAENKLRQSIPNVICHRIFFSRRLHKRCMGCVCGAVGRAVASDTRGLRFKSGKIYVHYQLYLKNKNKEKDARNGFRCHRNFSPRRLWDIYSENETKTTKTTTTTTLTATTTATTTTLTTTTTATTTTLTTTTTTRRNILTILQNAAGISNKLSCRSYYSK